MLSRWRCSRAWRSSRWARFELTLHRRGRDRSCVIAYLTLDATLAFVMLVAYTALDAAGLHQAAPRARHSSSISWILQGVGHWVYEELADYFPELRPQRWASSGSSLEGAQARPGDLDRLVRWFERNATVTPSAFARTPAIGSDRLDGRHWHERPVPHTLRPLGARADCSVRSARGPGERHITTWRSRLHGLQIAHATLSATEARACPGTVRVHSVDDRRPSSWYCPSVPLNR